MEQNPTESLIKQGRGKFEKLTDKEQRAVEIIRALLELEQTVGEEKIKEKIQATKAVIVGNLRAIIGDTTPPSTNFLSDEIEPMAEMLLQNES